MRWRIVPRQHLAWHSFEDELVVRNAQTGNTHLLEPLSAQIFLALLKGKGPMGIDDLRARVAGSEPGDNSNDEWRTAILAVLNEFQRLGLAFSETPSP